MAARHRRPNTFGAPDFPASDVAVTVMESTPADERHDNSWSINLEGDRHAESRELVVSEALDAVSRTEPGNHVNLVTHGDHGHPETYLYAALDAELDDARWEFVDRCGCGGYVTRVFV